MTYNEQKKFLQQKLADELEKRNLYRFGDVDVVRIPKIGGRIRTREKTDGLYVEYIYESWYDKEKKQGRNHKAIIGTIFPGYLNVMIPNENYYRFFDAVTGEARPQPDSSEADPEPSGNGEAPEITGKIEMDPELPEKGDNGGAAEKREPDTSEKRPERREKTEGQGDTYNENSGERTKEAEKAERDPENRNDQAESENPEIPETNPAPEKTEEKQKNAEDPEKRRTQNTPNSSINRKYQEDKGIQPDHRASENLAPGKEKTVQEMEEEQKKHREQVERMHLHYFILKNIHEGIRKRAQRRPDDIINEYKVQTINEQLLEIREYFQGSGYTDFMKLIREPEIVEKDGKEYLNGMTYSDVDVLLAYYQLVLEKTVFKHGPFGY